MISGNTIQKKPTPIKAILYSTKEFEWTIDAMKSALPHLTEENILASYSNKQTIDNYTLKIDFNKKKKFAHEVCATITVSPIISSEDIVIKDFHYGLGIIGTEKHESRRIDNQLRGRAGRQGDPGMSVFYVALDDSIMRKMGGEKIQGVASLLLPKAELEGLELTQSQFTNSIIRAQKQMEGWNFGIRKHLFDYDSVIDKQRQSIYKRRDTILSTLHDRYNSANMDTPPVSDPTLPNEIIANITTLIEQAVEDFFTLHHTLGTSHEELIDLTNREFGLQLDSQHIDSSFYNKSTQHITAHIMSKLEDAQKLL